MKKLKECFIIKTSFAIYLIILLIRHNMIFFMGCLMPVLISPMRFHKRINLYLSLIVCVVGI